MDNNDKVNNLIDAIVKSILDIKETDLSDDEKIAHIRGILKFSDVLLDNKD